MHEQVGSHPIWTFAPGPFGTLHSDTLITTWAVMAISLVFFGYIGRSYASNRVNKLQTTFEGITNYLGDLSISTLGPKGEPFVPVFVAIFFFILILNEIGFIPFKALGLPFGGSPTADLNTTAAFALVVFLGIQFVAIRRSGIKAYAHLFKPNIALFPINFIEEVTRPIVLALRLFFNIFVGELLLFVIATIVASNVHIGAFSLSLAAAFLPILLQFFNFFVGGLQAFIFTILTIVYLSLATAEEH
jgi:F-type H+-transporting ATPase subunit a